MGLVVDNVLMATFSRSVLINAPYPPPFIPSFPHSRGSCCPPTRKQMSRGLGTSERRLPQSLSIALALSRGWQTLVWRNREATRYGARCAPRAARACASGGCDALITVIIPHAICVGVVHHRCLLLFVIVGWEAQLGGSIPGWSALSWGPQGLAGRGGGVNTAPWLDPPPKKGSIDGPPKSYRD